MLSKQEMLSGCRRLYIAFYLSPGCVPALFVLVRLLSLCLRLTVNLSSRKIPGLNVYAQMQNEKEQEMMSPANPTEATPSSQQDLVHSLETLDTEFNSRPIGEYPLRFDSYLWLVFSFYFSIPYAIPLCVLFHETHSMLSVVCFSEVKWSGQGLNES